MSQSLIDSAQTRYPRGGRRRKEGGARRGIVEAGGGGRRRGIGHFGNMIHSLLFPKKKEEVSTDRRGITKSRETVERCDAVQVPNKYRYHPRDTSLSTYKRSLGTAVLASS